MKMLSIFAEALTTKGIRTYDALHIACAVEADCDYFLTTDRKLLKLQIGDLIIKDPIGFVIDMEEKRDDN